VSLEAVSLEACLRRVTLKSNSSIFKHLSGLQQIASRASKSMEPFNGWHSRVYQAPTGRRNC